MMQPVAEGEYQVSFNLAYLNGDRKIDRDVDRRARARARDRLSRSCRPSCATSSPPRCRRAAPASPRDTGDCTAPEERFADTFAKWALRGAVSAVGAGYSVATPASLEDWGAPLSALAIEIDVASR